MPALVLANGCRVRCYCCCLQALYSHNLAVNANGNKLWPWCSGLLWTGHPTPIMQVTF